MIGKVHAQRYGKQSSHQSLSKIALAISCCLAAQFAHAESAQIEQDNSTNPPSLSIEGNEDNSSWLMYGKWGKWTNVTATSDQKRSDITGIQLTSDSRESNVFEVVGDTNVYLMGIAKDDGSAGNIEGICISQGKTDPRIQATFNNVKIYAESTDPQRSRGKGLWIGGMHDISHDDETVHEHPEVAIKGNLDITAKSLGWAIGIDVGDELGDSNGHGGGHLTLSGANNTIFVQQTGALNSEGYLRASAGILISNQASVDIVGGNTMIKTITNHAGDQATMQGGVIVDRDASFTSAGSLVIDSTVTDSSKTHTLHGVVTDHYASSAHVADKGSVAILNGPTSITLRTNKKTYAYGLAAYGASTITTNGMVDIALDDSQSTIGGVYEFSGVYAGISFDSGTVAKNSGHVELNRGLRVTLPKGSKFGMRNYYAMKASGEYTKRPKRKPTILANGDELDVYQLQGNLYAEYRGIIDLTMANGQSYLTGWANNNDFSSSFAGTINLALKNGATWNVISQVNSYNNKVVDNESMVTSLDLSGGVLNMAYASRNQLTDWEEASHRQHLIISGTGSDQGLTGTGGTIWMDVNLADEGTETDLNLDQITINGTASGTHQLSVNFINGLGTVAADKMHSDNWLIAQESGSMTLTGPDGKDAFTGRGMVSMWTARFVPEGEEAKLDEDRESLDNTSLDKPNNGKGHWYLVRYDKPQTPTDPDNPETPPEISDNITIGTSASQAMAYLADLDDLRKRLGEVRYGAQDGAWVKAFSKKDSIDTASSRGFEQESFGINVGADRLLGASESSAWLMGASFRYGKSDQEGFGIGSTNGKLEEYSIKGYASWMHEKGSYADFVLQAGRYEQELSGLDNTGAGTSRADYGTWGYGASIELGHMFSFGEEVDDRQWFNHWFIEPQLQLAYFYAQGADYRTSTGLKVDQEDVDFLTGRAGVVIGKKFNYATIDDLDKRYFQVSLIGGVKHEFLGDDQRISYRGIEGDVASVNAQAVDGTRFYYGINADWQVSNDWRLYAQIDREEGDEYTKDYDISVGLKYAF